MLNYVSFLKKCLTPHHTAKFIKELLLEKNYEEFNFDKKISKGNYFYIYKTMIVIFKIPDNPLFFRIIGTHCDSPVLKLKPNPLILQENLKILNLKTYGGGLFHTFFDRPLSIAGLVIRNEKEEIIEISNAAYIPSLAPHSAREIYKDGFTFDKENHLKAVLLKEELLPFLENSLSFDLSLLEERVTETDEFIFSGRHDNLSSTYSAVKCILEDVSDQFICMTAIFDNEEIGSETVCGAQSSVFSKFLEKLANDLKISSFTNSFFLSADAGHCDHPNYLEKTDKNHPIKFNKGTVIKYGSGYSTDVYGSALIKSLGADYQVMCVKNGVPCGGTIGSMISVKLGMPCVDIGAPLLGMHSCCEMVAKKDIEHLNTLMKEFFNKI